MQKGRCFQSILCRMRFPHYPQQMEGARLEWFRRMNYLVQRTIKYLRLTDAEVSRSRETSLHLLRLLCGGSLGRSGRQEAGGRTQDPSVIEKSRGCRVAVRVLISEHLGGHVRTLPEGRVLPVGS